MIILIAERYRGHVEHCLRCDDVSIAYPYAEELDKVRQIISDDPVLDKMVLPRRGVGNELCPSTLNLALLEYLVLKLVKNDIHLFLSTEVRKLLLKDLGYSVATGVIDRGPWGERVAFTLLSKGGDWINGLDLEGAGITNWGVPPSW